MPLTGHVYGGYASYEGGHGWGDHEHVAHKFIQILKGEQANGYAWLPRPNGASVKISTALSERAFQAWGRWAASVATKLLPQGGFLVPIPSSGCTAIGQDEKGRALATAISQHAPAFMVMEALHWAEEWPKARNGGPRDPDILLSNVRVLPNLEKRPVILVDDVITGGGHAIACAKALRSRGHAVEHVIAAARTVKGQPPNGMFNIDSWDLEAPKLLGW